MKVYSAVRIGQSHVDRQTPCDDRILVDGKVYEDGYHEAQIDGPCVLAVSDGVGGTGCGFKAAETALMHMAEWDCSDFDGEDLIIAGVAETNRNVVTIRQEKEWYGTAATLSAVVFTEDKTYLIHAGDSRITQKRTLQGHTFFRQLTEDQDRLQQWLAEEDDVTEDELKQRRGWNQIWGYLGLPEDEFHQVCVIEPVISGKMLVLTTDGIHDYIDKKTFSNVLDEPGDWQEKLERIMQIARQNGSKDDQSIIVIEDM